MINSTMMEDLSMINEILARKSFGRFVRYVNPVLEFTNFHLTYYDILDKFAKGEIKRLIVSIPPQHGKSLGSSQLLPAYILGVDPDVKIAIASYAFSLATKFNKRIQRVIKDEKYQYIFPHTKLKDSIRGDASASSYIQTSEEFEVVGHSGSVRSVGREGALTGNPVDIMIIDDLYKDAMEANSPIVRDNTWEFYTSVVRTRMHNDSRELVVFTRWHEDDLIGRIEKAEQVIELHSVNQIDPDYDGWYKLNFEAIKESPSTPIDPRLLGVPLWSNRHGMKSLEAKRSLDRLQFDCMYQGHPGSKEGLLYSDFGVYDTLPDTIKKANYTDTADMGSDKLCSICYEVGKDKMIYITDILYTSEPMEVTEVATANMMSRNNTRIAHIESNNGGRGFARAVGKHIPTVSIEWFHQSANKEARILTNAATVTKNILMPRDWMIRWSDFHGDIISFKKVFRANKTDDAADTLTGIVEKELLTQQLRRPKISFT